MPTTRKVKVSPLRAFRLQRLGQSVEETAAALKVHKASLARLETGDLMPSKSFLLRVLAFLKKHKAAITVEQIVLPEQHLVSISV